MNYSDIVSRFIYCLFCLASIQLLLYIGSISTLNFELKSQLCRIMGGLSAAMEDDVHILFPVVFFYTFKSTSGAGLQSPPCDITIILFNGQNRQIKH